MSTGIPASPEEMKKKAEELTAEAAYFEALSKRDTAMKAAQSPTPSEAAAAATEARAAKNVMARKSEAETKSAEAAARKEEVEAETAKTKAMTDAVPSAGVPGAADAADGAGKAEAMLLGAAALRGIAVQFACALAKVKQGTVAGWVLCTAAAPPRFDQLVAFDAQYHGLKDALARAGVDIDRLRAGRLASGLAAVTAGLTIVDKLLGFFRSDHKLHGMDVASADEALLVALAEQLLYLGETVHIPAYFQPPQASGSAIVERLAAPFEWAELVQEQREFLDRQVVNEEAAQVRTQAIKDDPNSSAEVRRDAELELEKVLADLTRDRARLAILKGLAERIDAWMKALTTPDAQARLPVAQVAQQGQLRQLLDEGCAVVVLQPHKVAGSLHVKRNLWSALLWFTPFHAMGGAVASFTAFHGRSGALIGAGYQARHGGYQVVTRAKEHVDRAMSLMAWKPQPSTGSTS